MHDETRINAQATDGGGDHASALRCQYTTHFRRSLNQSITKKWGWYFRHTDVEFIPLHSISIIKWVLFSLPSLPVGSFNFVWLLFQQRSQKKRLVINKAHQTLKLAANRKYFEEETRFHWFWHLICPHREIPNQCYHCDDLMVAGIVTCVKRNKKKYSRLCATHTHTKKKRSFW